jgi:DUF438 domain-containing protein
MDLAPICKAIVDSFPYPVVFLDIDHIVRYMNRAAIYHYCTERGHLDLVGQSLFDCHFNPASRAHIEKAVEGFKKDAKEIYLKVSDRNLRVYITPVRDESAGLIGYYERFEMNLQLAPQPNKASNRAP